MTYHEAIKKYKYAKRKNWVGEYTDCKTEPRVIHRLPGLDHGISEEDYYANDWEEFHIPNVGDAVMKWETARRPDRDIALEVVQEWYHQKYGDKLTIAIKRARKAARREKHDRQANAKKCSD